MKKFNQAAFDELKRRLCSAPILAHPLFDRLFILYTDASAEAFAAVLCQVWIWDDYIQTDDASTLAMTSASVHSPRSQPQAPNLGEMGSETQPQTMT